MLLFLIYKNCCQATLDIGHIVFRRTIYRRGLLFTRQEVKPRFKTFIFDSNLSSLFTYYLETNCNVLTNNYKAPLHYSRSLPESKFKLLQLKSFIVDCLSNDDEERLQLSMRSSMNSK